MKKNNLQKGVAGILVVFVLIIVIAVGIYVWYSNQNGTQIINTTRTQKTPAGEALEVEPTISDSDRTEDIEAELNDTLLDEESLNSDLSNINDDLNELQ